MIDLYHYCYYLLYLLQKNPDKYKAKPVPQPLNPMELPVIPGQEKNSMPAAGNSPLKSAMGKSPLSTPSPLAGLAK